MANIHSIDAAGLGTDFNLASFLNSNKKFVTIDDFPLLTI